VTITAPPSRGLRKVIMGTKISIYRDGAYVGEFEVLCSTSNRG
jgi:hypothetical protein